MFDNIGQKIKTMATILTWVGCVSSFIGGVAVLASRSTIAWIGLVIIILGVLISWTTSFTLYGFGELVDNSSIIVRRVSKSSKSKERVEQLINWRDKGLITNEEFQIQINQINGD